MALHIESGHPVTADVEQVAGNSVRFVTEDGRTMFEVRAGDDGRSIEVRAVEVTKHGGVIYDGMLLIEPRSANGVNLRTAKYRD